MFDAVAEDQVDYVRAYFGMRKISLGRIGGEKNLRPLLNDKFVFHMGMLDQVRLFKTKLMVWTLRNMHRPPTVPMHCLWVACTHLMPVDKACAITAQSILLIIFIITPTITTVSMYWWFALLCNLAHVHAVSNLV